MNKKKALEVIKEIIVDIMDDETIEITEETIFKSLPEWESVAMMTMIAMVENEFGTKFTVEEIENIVKVEDVLHKVI